MREPGDSPSLSEMPDSVLLILERLEAARAQLALRIEPLGDREASSALASLEQALQELRAAHPHSCAPPPCEREGCIRDAIPGGKFCDLPLHKYSFFLCSVRGCQEPAWYAGVTCYAHIRQWRLAKCGDFDRWLAIRRCVPPPPPGPAEELEREEEIYRKHTAELQRRGARLCDLPNCWREAWAGRRCHVHMRLLAGCLVRGCSEAALHDDGRFCQAHLHQFGEWLALHLDEFTCPESIWMITLESAARRRRRASAQASSGPPAPIPGLGSAITVHGLPAGEAPEQLTNALLGVDPRCVAGDCGRPRVEAHALCELHLRELESSPPRQRFRP
jgi:hypothetical protein